MASLLISVDIKQDQAINFIRFSDRGTGDNSYGTGERHYNRTMDDRQAVHVVLFFLYQG
jgi:hypothetical protein